MRHGLKIITQNTQIYINRSRSDAFVFLSVACDPTASCVIQTPTDSQALAVGDSFVMHWLVPHGEALEVNPTGGSVAYELETEFRP